MAGTLTVDDSSAAPITTDRPIVPVAPPVTEDAFVADHLAFWKWFTGSIARAAGALVVLLILLWFFLVR